MKKKESGDESAAVGVLKVTRWIVPCLSGHPQEQSRLVIPQQRPGGIEGTAPGHHVDMGAFPGTPARHFWKRKMASEEI